MLEERVRAAESVAVMWQDSGVPFVVMHGLEAYPEGLGRDLDILMPFEESDRALNSAGELLHELGWRVARPSPIFGPRLLALKGDPGRPLYLELHTMPALRWAALDLVTPNDVPDSSEGPFPVSAWATFAKSVISPLLGKDLARFDHHYLREVDPSRSDSDQIIAGGSRLFGHELMTQLLSAVDRPDTDRVRQLSGPFRRAAMGQMLRNPGRSLKTLPRFVAQKTGRLRDTSGIRLSLELPEDVDREKLLIDLTDRVGHILTPIEIGREGSWRQRQAQQYRTLSRQGLVVDVAECDSDRSSVRATFQTGISEAGTVEYSGSTSPDAELSAEIAKGLIREWWRSLGGSAAVDTGDSIARNRTGEE